MRLFPPIPTLGRQLAKDTVFSHRFNNHQEITLKKGLNIGISIFALHRNPYVWKNPEVSEKHIKKICFSLFLLFVLLFYEDCYKRNFKCNQIIVLTCGLLRKYRLYIFRLFLFLSGFCDCACFLYQHKEYFSKQALSVFLKSTKTHYFKFMRTYCINCNLQPAI